MRYIKVGSIWVEKSKTVGKYVWRIRYENPVTCKAEKTSITLTSKSKQAGNQALNLMLDKIKKNASNRKVYLSNRSIEILAYFKSDNTRLLQNDRSFVDYGYIFPSRTGNPVSWRDLGRSFANFGKRAGFDRKFSPHALRHSHITHLVESGADQVAIMERVGHSDPTISTKIYTHTTDKMSSRLVDLIDEN